MTSNTAYQRLWRLKHPFKWIEYALKRVAQLGEDEIRKRRHDWYLKNRDAIRQKAREYYLKHRERLIARTRKWSADNKERRIAVKRVYYYRTREQRCAYSRDYYHKHRDEVRQKELKKRSANREPQRLQARAHSAAVTERYAREQLSKYSPVSMPQWPEELVQAKQAEIRLKRILKEKQHGQDL